jgi:hypothetical protein
VHECELIFPLITDVRQRMMASNARSSKCRSSALNIWSDIAHI